ncbi:MAG: PIN domain-containing protein [Verrucomicrobiae bacterium]|nr:PIN domain-containing protein [Verrucomicrobiae bacterium]
MIVCLDTNSLLQMFGRRSPYRPILKAGVDGHLTLAVSTPILLEYEEAARELYGAEFWQEAAIFLRYATAAWPSATPRAAVPLPPHRC